MSMQVDLCVVGAGPGGYVAAIRAAQLGMQVACVEKESALGGTCLRVGCIPSKALLDSSEHYWHAGHGLAAHGIEVAGLELDLAAMMARKTKVVRGLTQGIRGLFRKHAITWVSGTARLEAPGRVRVLGADGEQVVEAGRVLIATGSEPAPLANLPFDGEYVVSSTEALAFERVPARLLVVGGGAIGLELGSVWNRLGAQVTVVEFLDRIAPGMDADLARQLHTALEHQGMRLWLQTKAEGAVRTETGVRVTLEREGGHTEEEVDRVLVAVGRRPHAEGLGARELGVAFDEGGRIVVDEHFETDVAGVFAIGDVIRGPMLAHKAEEEGVACVETMAGHAGEVNYAAIPSVIYTAPEFAGVGLTAEDAARQGRRVRTGSFPFMANGRARALGETQGGVSIVADAETDALLGVHVLGPRASDLIAEAVVAIEFGGSAEDLARSVHAHPTFSEAIKEAALAVDGRALSI